MTDITESELLEPTPYDNAYRRTLMDADPSPETPDPELLDIPDGDTQEAEGLIKAQDAKEHDWKKRYSDLKSYHDRKNNEWTQQNELTEAKLKLAEQKVSAPQNLPKSQEELEEFKKEYPDVYDVVETVSRLQANASVKEVEDRIESLRKAEREAQIRTAEKELLSVHPDFLEIKSDSEFLTWLEEQPKSISDGVYKNRTDFKWAARVIDLYKSDTNIGQKKRGRPSKANVEAARAVTKTERAVTTGEGEKKVWSSSEIARLKPHEFETLEKEIDKANREGRITP